MTVLHDLKGDIVLQGYFVYQVKHLVHYGDIGEDEQGSVTCHELGITRVFDFDLPIADIIHENPGEDLLKFHNIPIGLIVHFEVVLLINHKIMIGLSRRSLQLGAVQAIVQTVIVNPLHDGLGAHEDILVNRGDIYELYRGLQERYFLVVVDEEMQEEPHRSQPEEHQADVRGFGERGRFESLFFCEHR